MRILGEDLDQRLQFVVEGKAGVIRRFGMVAGATCGSAHGADPARGGRGQDSRISWMAVAAAVAAAAGFQLSRICVCPDVPGALPGSDPPARGISEMPRTMPKPTACSIPRAS